MKHLLHPLLPLLALSATALPAQEQPSREVAPTLSPLAQELAQCGEDAAGIRARLELILNHLTENAEAYHIQGLTVPNLGLIPIAVEEGDGRYLGGAQWAASSTIFKIRMRFFTAALPAAHDADSKLTREMILIDTLVHELAHCFFYSRYPKIAKLTQEAPLTICEGYAIHVARAFMARHYYGSTTLPATVYEQNFLSPRYTRLYRNFCTTYTDANGRILWPRIDTAELHYAPQGYTLRNRTQISGQ